MRVLLAIALLGTCLVACGVTSPPRSPLEQAIASAQTDMHEAFMLGLDASRQITPLRILARWNPPPSPEAGAPPCGCSQDFPFELRLHGRWHRFSLDRDSSQPDALARLNTYRAGATSRFPEFYLIGELRTSLEPCSDTGQRLPVLVLEAVEPLQ